tara:strand:+ start:1719 stop:1979 length:261 start_codon:yes stop_codon:yes gene_type:complete
MLGGVDKWIAGFLSLGIFTTVSAVVIGAIRDTQVTDSAAYNASDNSLTAVGNITAQFGTAGTLVGLGVLALAAIVIVGYFGMGRRN